MNRSLWELSAARALGAWNVVAPLKRFELPKTHSLFEERWLLVWRTYSFRLAGTIDQPMASFVFNRQRFSYLLHEAAMSDKIRAIDRCNLSPSRFFVKAYLLRREHGGRRSCSRQCDLALQKRLFHQIAKSLAFMPRGGISSRPPKSRLPKYIWGPPSTSPATTAMRKSDGPGNSSRYLVRPWVALHLQRRIKTRRGAVHAHTTTTPTTTILSPR